MWFKKVSPRLAGKSGYLLLLGVIIINALVQGKGFFSGNNLSSVLSTNLPVVIAAIAQMIIMLSGGIDISIGNVMAFTNVIAIALANTHGYPLGLSWAIALAAGTLAGFTNGLIVGYVRVPPLLATFASSSLFLGVSLLVFPKPGGTVPPVIYKLYGGNWLGLPTSLWILIVVVLLMLLIARYPFMRYISAVGSNERNAYASGIAVDRIKLAAYTLSGFVAGIAGLCLTALTASGNARIGNSFVLTSIAAVIIGGTLQSSKWRDYLGGAIAGALFLALVNNIVFFAFTGLSNHFPDWKISTFYQQLLSNFIIIGGLASAVLTNRTGKKRVKPQSVVEEAPDDAA
ncbi:MAG: ABC transporter permease [Anaerolineaceae bacterium]|nr:ABC transporter permease [Anaerolineaceae bacterium]